MISKPLKKIVAEWIGSADQSSDQFWRLYNIGRRGMENEFNLDVTGGFQTVLLDVNANKTVQIPVWCCGISKVGIVNEAGEIVTLHYNSQLTTYHDIYYNENQRINGLPILNTFGVGNQIPTGAPYLFPYYYLNFYNSGTTFNLFGLPSGTAAVGFYKIDTKNNVILLNVDFPYNQLVFEGLTSGLDDNTEDYMIDIRVAEAMIWWIRWQQMVDLPKKYSAGMVKMAEKGYYNAKRKANVRLNPANIELLQMAERASWKLVPKA